MHFLAERMAQVKLSPSMAASQAAKKLLAQGIYLIDLGMDELDFDILRHVIEAAKSGHTRYTVIGSASDVSLLTAIDRLESYHT